jgi:hypothetical protein
MIHIPTYIINYIMAHKDIEKDKEYRKQYYLKNAKKIKLYEKEYREKNKEILKEKRKEYYGRDEVKEKHYKSNAKYQSERIRTYKILALEMIAKYHDSPLECWRCHEDRLCVLTIGHPKNNGKDDRYNNGTGTKFYKAIFSGNRTCEDLQVECINCNCCLQWYKKYPDEMTNEYFKKINTYRKNENNILMGV